MLIFAIFRNAFYILIHVVLQPFNVDLVINGDLFPRSVYSTGKRDTVMSEIGQNKRLHSNDIILAFES